MIKEYDNGIFPRKLVITDDIEQADKRYARIDGIPLQKVDGAIAVTFRTTDVKNDNACILLAIFIDEEFDDGTTSHESLHIARCMLDGIVDELNDYTEEVFCYVSGWAARCIADFKRTVKED